MYASVAAGSVAGRGFSFPTTYPSSCHQKQHWQVWLLAGHRTWCCRLWSHTFPQSLSLDQKSAGLKREKAAASHNQNGWAHSLKGLIHRMLLSEAAALPQHWPERGQLQQCQEGHEWKYGSYSSKNVCTYWIKGTPRALTAEAKRRQSWKGRAEISHAHDCAELSPLGAPCSNTTTGEPVVADKKPIKWTKRRWARCIAMFSLFTSSATRWWLLYILFFESKLTLESPKNPIQNSTYFTYVFICVWREGKTPPPASQHVE